MNWDAFVSICLGKRNVLLLSFVLFLLKLLLAHKVDPTIKSKQGVTALDLAKEYKNQPAIDILSKL